MASSVPSTSQQANPTSFAPVFALWLVLSIALLGYALPSILSLKATDPDDYMRLAEVRDWLSGQPWSDVRQHRMGLPPGADMHWSRLVDVPIASILWLARLLIAEPLASAVAMATVPLLELLVAMALLHRLSRRLGATPVTALAAAALPLLFPLLASNFMPMRIDHHAWQAVCALAAALALQYHGCRGPVLAGAIGAIWLTISLEGLVLVFALAGLLAWRTLRAGQPALAQFCGSLASVGTALAVATRGSAELLVAHPDQLSWPHLAAFATAAAVAALAARLPAFASPRFRVLALACAALAAAAALLAGLGPAAFDPFHGLDPIVRRLWLENIPEGLPLNHQDWQTRASLIWTPLLVLLGWRQARKDQFRGHHWDELALFALAACALSFALMRGAVAAQLLAVPFSALLLARHFPRAAALPSAMLRLPAMLACLLLLTPSLVAQAGHLLDRQSVAPSSPSLRPNTTSRAAGCDLSELARLPRAHILAPLDLGPEILVRTGHSVVAGSYHRNSAMMHIVIETFSGDLAHAQVMAQASHASMLAFCPASAEIGIYAARRPDNLASLLTQGRPIAWLRPLPGFASGLKVFRITD